MGQIIGGAAKPRRCNIQSLSSLGTPAAGEYILVSSDNSMNAAGQGNFDCYIVGDGTTAAENLTLNFFADKAPTEGSGNPVSSGGIYEVLNGTPDWNSRASISIRVGISTSSSTKYAFNNAPILYSGKTYKLYIEIQNNAINGGTLYLKNSGGTKIYFSTDGNRTNARAFTNGYTAVLTLEGDVYYASFSLTDANIAATGDIIVTITEENTGTKGIYDNIQDLQDKDDNLQSQIDKVASVGIDNKGDTLVKELINASRSYYFAQGWGAGDDYGFLDTILASVPVGKHFLIYTDIHLDYGNNWGLLQKQPIIMKYIQDRLCGCKVIFGGDVIGAQATELSAKKELLYFHNENYSLFGDSYIPILGDHDTDRVNGGLAQGSQLTEEFLYESVFKQAYIYGAVQDGLGISAIDGISSFSDSKKEAWKNYMRMHYYVDDIGNKIRFIIIQEGAVFRTITANYNTSAVQLPFIAKSILDAPNDYDIVIAGHEFQIGKNGAWSVTRVWEKQLGLILSAFKNAASYTLSHPTQSDADEIAVWNAVTAVYDSTFDYGSKTGNAVVLQGDEHYDCANYFNASQTESNFALPTYTPTQNDVLRIIFDRATLVQNVGFPTGQFSNVDLVLKGYRRAIASTAATPLLGTTSEVLFDIVTLTPNGKIVLTRVGDKPVAGRAGLFPVFDENTSYSVGDIVVYYEIVDSNYMIKAYQFVNAHAGAWNINDVVVYEVTEPYNREFTL